MSGGDQKRGGAGAAPEQDEDGDRKAKAAADTAADEPSEEDDEAAAEALAVAERAEEDEEDREAENEEHERDPDAGDRELQALERAAIATAERNSSFASFRCSPFILRVMRLLAFLTLVATAIGLLLQVFFPAAVEALSSRARAAAARQAAGEATCNAAFLAEADFQAVVTRSAALHVVIFFNTRTNE